MKTVNAHNNNDNNSIKNSNNGNMKQMNSNAAKFSVEFLLSEHHSPASDRKDPALTSRCTVDLDHSWQLTQLDTVQSKKDKVIKTDNDIHSYPANQCNLKSKEYGGYTPQTKHDHRSRVFSTYPADSTFESPDRMPAPPAQGVSDVGRYDIMAAPVVGRDCDAGYNSSGTSSVDLDRYDDSNDNETLNPRERSVSVSSSTSELIMVDCSDGELPKDNADGVKKSGEKLKGKKRRVLFTKQQTFELERKFCSKWYISPQERDNLAKELQMNPEQVKIWFQNHRYKFKRMQKDYHDRGIPTSGGGVRSGPYRRPDAVTEYLCQEMSRGRALTDIARRASGVYESEYLHALALGLAGGVAPYADAWVRPAGVPYYPTHHLMQPTSPYANPLALHQRLVHGLPNHYLGGMPASSWLPTTASR